MNLAHALSRRSVHWPVLAGAATVGLFTGMTKVAAAVKIAVTARYFGRGDEIDAFLTAFLLPTLFADTLASAFTQGLVPGLVRAREQMGEPAARRLAQAGLSFAFASMLVLMVTLVVGAPWIVPVLGSSFGPGKLRLTTALFLGLLAWLPLGGMIASWRAVLNAHGKFGLAAAAPLTTPLFNIAFLVAGGAQQGVWVLVLATLTGVATEWLILLAAVRALGYPVLPQAWQWRARTDWFREVCDLGRQYLPLMSVATLASASTVIDQAFAGALGPGSVSTLTYGSKLAGVTVVVASMAIGTAVLPEFSRMASQDQWAQLRRSALLYAGLLAAVFIPVALVLGWFSEPLARLFFERGAFGSADTRFVSTLQRYALLEAPFAILLALGSRLTTAISANSLLATISAIAVVANIVCDWFLSRWMGVNGIAVASAVVRVVALIALVVLLYRREPRLFRRGI